MSKNTKGFTLVEGLLIVLILCVVGFAGYYVMNNREKKTNDSTASQSTQTATPSNTTPQTTAAAFKTKTFTNKDFGVSVDLPETWTTKDESMVENGVPFIFSVTVSDGKDTASLFTTNGKGGFCESKPTDKPYASGNACPTQEYTLVTKTNDGGSLSRSKLANTDGTIAYWMCYTPKTLTSPVANKPVTGAVANCGASDILVRIPNNSDEKAYTTDFVASLEKSLKTLSYIPKN